MVVRRVLGAEVERERVERVAGQVEQAHDESRGGRHGLVGDRGAPEDVLGRPTDRHGSDDALEGRHARPSRQKESAAREYRSWRRETQTARPPWQGGVEEEVML